MRAPSPPFVTEIAAAITRPGYLVEFGFSTPFRISSRGTTHFAGSIFIEWGFSVGNLSSGQGSITVLDPDRTMQAYLLNEGIADKRTRIWLFYGDVIAPTPIAAWNPMLQFDGFVGRCRIDPNSNQVSMSLLSSSGVTEYVPRTRIIKENGFNWLPQAGKVIEFGGQKFILNPDTSGN